MSVTRGQPTGAALESPRTATPSAFVLREALDRQRASFLSDGVWSAAARKERLRRLRAVLLQH